MIFTQAHSRQAAVKANPVIMGVVARYAEIGVKTALEFPANRAVPAVRLRVDWVSPQGEARQAHIVFHDDGKVTAQHKTLKAQPVFPVPRPSGDPAVELANEIAIEQIATDFVPEAVQAAGRTALRSGNALQAAPRAPAYGMAN